MNDKINWISVKDRLPSPYQWVLVCDDPKGTGEPRCINIFRHDGKNWDSIHEPGDSPTFSDIIYDLQYDEVAFWMPLPKRPAKDSH